MTKRTFSNPILPGFYPDPSILRVEDDFYLICSSFGLFPGIPVFHSKDLVNWKQIGNALDRVSQHYVRGDSLEGGVMAPTIRYYNGTYYIIVANFAIGGNIMITAKDPAGPWSDPVFLEDIPGIDASIFFDEDGKCYVQGTGNFDENNELLEGNAFGANRGIWICEFDVNTMKAVSEKKYAWGGALKNTHAPEAPHLYKKDGWYYLLIAEGGTEHYHAVTVARSREVMGEYEGFRGNPILTHRHLGYDYPIGNIGHADFVELQNGEWWGVALGSRFIEGYHKNLGRETYLFPMTWQNEWPVLCPMEGKVNLVSEAPDLPETPVEKEAGFDDFDSDKLAMYWTTIGTPDPCFYELKNSELILDLHKRSIFDAPFPMRMMVSKEEKVDLLSYVCRRQKSFTFDFSAEMDFSPQKEGESAGILMDHADNDFVLEYGLFNGEKKLRLSNIRLHTTGSFITNDLKSEKTAETLFEIPLEADHLVLRICERENDLLFSYGKDKDSLVEIPVKGDARNLTIPVDGGMVGTMIGMYATSSGAESTNKARFLWSEYQDI